MRHNLKIDPAWLEAVRDGQKKAEIRKGDRPFCVGDELVLYLRDQSRGVLTSVTHVLELDAVPGCESSGYVALSISVLGRLDTSTEVEEALASGSFG